jgi:small basic protein (TIGR04137 family)
LLILSETGGGARSRLLSSSRREEAHSFSRRKFEPPYVGCYGERWCCWFIEPHQINRLQSAGNRLFCPLGFAGNSTERKFMSQHRSLRAASTLGGKRNVLKRFERTALLEKRGQRKAGDRITGLRKTKPEV